MKKVKFDSYCSSHSAEIEEIKNAAWALHASVNQTYDDTLPYGHHLSMVADAAMAYGHDVIVCEEDIIPVIFAAYYHDSIEDARLTYNDVMKIAKRKMSDEQALMATEIVYALTNDKGRTRAERAGEKYYAGIRSTPYAPLIKLCDRYANMSYSFHGSDESNIHMRGVYAREWQHFLSAITVATDDMRFHLPKELIEENLKCIEVAKDNEMTMKIRYATLSKIGNRYNNEDAFKIIDHQEDGRWMGIVCDGMGGHANGEVASETVVNAICDYWDGHKDEVDGKDKVENACKVASESRK